MNFYTGAEQLAQQSVSQQVNFFFLLNFAAAIPAVASGGITGTLFAEMFTLTQNCWKIDDVLGVWSLRGLRGAWGGMAAGIFWP